MIFEGFVIGDGGHCWGYPVGEKKNRMQRFGVQPVANFPTKRTESRASRESCCKQNHENGIGAHAERTILPQRRPDVNDEGANNCTIVEARL